MNLACFALFQNNMRGVPPLKARAYYLHQCLYNVFAKEFVIAEVNDGRKLVIKIIDDDSGQP